MTPTPLISFLWGFLLTSGILRDDILGFRVLSTPGWRRGRRIIGIAAILSGGLWLSLDLALPFLLPPGGSGARVADAIGWCAVAVAAATATWVIVSRRPASRTLSRPH